MRRFMTAMAAIALVSGAGHAQGNGRGGGQGGGGPQSAQDGRGGKPDKAGESQGGGGMQAMAGPREGNGNKDRANAERGQGGGSDNRGGGQGGNGRDGQAMATSPNSGSKDRGSSRANDRGHDNRGEAVDRGRGNDRIVAGRGREIDVVRISDFASAPGRGLIAGCPPGLAKKSPPCVPPGQVRNRLPGYDRPDFWGLGLGDGRYWYDDGYLFRLGPNGRIGGFIPLLGGALAIGNVWPTFYQSVALPNYYERYYGLGPYDGYRYADNVIYRVDPETAAITSIAALLTGDNFVVGRPIPAGYDVYNVPYPYRAQYYDRPDALYRYSDGYVYQVDPETRLIAAAIELIAS